MGQSMTSLVAFDQIWKIELVVRSSVVSHEGRPIVPNAQWEFIWCSRAWSSHELRLAALMDDSWAFLPLCKSVRWAGVNASSWVFFSSACWETERGGEWRESILPGTYLILKNLLLVSLCMSVTVFLMVPFSSLTFLWVLSGERLVSLVRFRVPVIGTGFCPASAAAPPGLII